MSAFTKGNLELRAVPGGLGGVISQLVIHNRAGEGGDFGVTDNPDVVPEPSRCLAGSRETVTLPGLNCTMTVALRTGQQTDVLRIRVIDGRHVERVKLPKPPRPDPVAPQPDLQQSGPTKKRGAKKAVRKASKPMGKKRMYPTKD